MRVEVKIDEAKMRSLISSIRRSTDFVEKGMAREVEQAVNYTERVARANALARLPRGGGLAGTVAKSKFSQRRNRGNGYAVELTVSGPYNLMGIDEGVVIHPTYGRQPWVEQRVPSGWLSDAIQGATDEFIEDVDSLVFRSVSLVK